LLIQRYKSLYPEVHGTITTKQTKDYNREAGIEASIEDLRESSGYSQATIWLFSVELFNKELKKFNLKIKAEVAEKEAAYKAALAESKSKNL